LVDSGGLAIRTEQEVDDLGRVIVVHLPRTVDVSDDRFAMRTGYNDLDQVVETTSSKPFEFKTRHFYDRNGKLQREERQVKDGNGVEILGGVEVRTYCYDEEFNLIRETIGGSDLSGYLVTKHRYDSAGQRVLTIMPQGNEMHIKYDQRLLPVAHTIGYGTADASTTRMEYDGDGWVKRTFDARGNPKTYTLDPFGRVVAEEDIGGTSPGVTTTAGECDLARVFERQPDGSYRLLSRSETEYDELGRAIRSGVNRFDEPPDPVQKEALDDAFASPGLGELLVTQTFYDAEGRVRRTVDPAWPCIYVRIRCA
jgi:YD repeat-containing protein